MSKKIERQIRDAFTKNLREGVRKRFDLAVTTEWNIITGGYVTHREDDAPFTPIQYGFVAGFEAGYLSALAMVQS